ncbi:hypothetical protein B1A85_20955 [Chroococcidiopsis sp. TS-821]|nr:hypothetical protein B1A85_20955 [Chroococcidiopsis sp. TS-821]
MLLSLTILSSGIMQLIPQAANANPPNNRYADCSFAFPYVYGSPIPCPTTVSTYNRPLGFIDTVSRTVVSGWAEDYDITGPINVHIYKVVNGVRSFVTAQPANLYRADGNIGYHGFYVTGSFPVGASIEVYAIGVSGVYGPFYPFCQSNRVDCGEPDGENSSLPTSGTSRIVK